MSNNVVAIAPRFATDGSMSAMGFPARDLNHIMNKKYLDDLEIYQRLFGLYSFMPLRYDYKYRLFTPQGNPFMWQPKTNCSYNELGQITVGLQELTPCKAYVHTKFCHDEFFDSCFRQLVRWDTDGSIDLGPDGERVFDTMLQELLKNASLGLRVLLTSGQLYASDVALNPDAPLPLKNAFMATKDTCRGWIKLFKDLSEAGYPWLNIYGLIPSELTAGACSDFSGSIVSIYDDLKCQAKPGLQKLINRGSIPSNGSINDRALFVVSDTIFNGLANEYNAQSVLTAQNRPRIDRMPIPGLGGFMPFYVYTIDGIPVVPLSDINEPDQALAGQTHFAGIIAAGNIQLGHNFASFPENIETDKIGMLIEKVTTNENGNMGQYVLTSNALVAVALADPNYAVATINYVTP